MSQTIVERRPFGNPAGSNKKQREIARLRSVALDDAESAVERLVAAQKLLSRFRLSRDNAKIIRRTIQTFIRDADAGVQERATKLKKRFLSAKELKAIEKQELPGESEISSAIFEELPSAAPTFTAANAFCELLGNSTYLVAQIGQKVEGLTQEFMEQVIRRVTGIPAYAELPDIATLSETKQNLIADKVFYDLRLEHGAEEFQLIIHHLETSGVANDFPGIVTVFRRSMESTMQLLDALNRRVQVGV